MRVDICIVMAFLVAGCLGSNPPTASTASESPVSSPFSEFSIGVPEHGLAWQLVEVDFGDDVSGGVLHVRPDLRLQMAGETAGTIAFSKVAVLARDENGGFVSDHFVGEWEISEVEANTREIRLRGAQALELPYRGRLFAIGIVAAGTVPFSLTGTLEYDGHPKSLYSQGAANGTRIFLAPQPAPDPRASPFLSKANWERNMSEFSSILVGLWQNPSEDPRLANLDEAQLWVTHACRQANNTLSVRGPIIDDEQYSPPRSAEVPNSAAFWFHQCDAEKNLGYLRAELRHTGPSPYGMIMVAFESSLSEYIASGLGDRSSQ